MKAVCGEAYQNVKRDNQRMNYMEQFMIKVPKKTKMQQVALTSRAAEKWKAINEAEE